LFLCFQQSKSIAKIDSSDFKLSPGDAEIARKNFGETDEIRRQSIDLLRDWAEKNPRIERIRLDSSFLLRYLRSRKFSVPMAQELIERLAIQRLTKYDDGIQHMLNLNFHDLKVQDLINRG
jgi:hypothetical protein